jgi:hypothetical protein
MRRRSSSANLKGGITKINISWKPSKKRPLGKYRSRWEDTIKRYLKEIGF